MREILRLSSIPKAFAFLTGIGSLALMVYGCYGESYWAGCGLVLLMTSLLLIVSLTGQQQQTSQVNVVRLVKDSSKVGVSPGPAPGYYVKRA